MLYQREESIHYLKYLLRRPIWRDTSPYLFSHARTALKYGLLAYNVTKGQEILVPEFICDAVLQPLNELEIRPVFYPVNEMLEPIWEDVKSKLSSNTIAIMMIHYFGFPQKIEMFSEFAKRHQLLLIEDNAHGYGGQLEEKLLGTFGDIGITSIRKSLPVINGAFLYLKERELRKIAIDLGLEEKNIFYSEFRKMAKYFIKSSALLRRIILKVPPYDNPNGFQEETIDDWAMDCISYRYVLAQNLSHIVKNRQETYKVWEKWAITYDLKPLFGLKTSDQIAPLIFPAFTRSLSDRKKWFEWGFKNGIDVHSWPSLPEQVRNPRYNAVGYWEKLVCFPIHNGIKPAELHRFLKRCQ